MVQPVEVESRLCQARLSHWQEPTGKTFCTVLQQRAETIGVSVKITFGPRRLGLFVV